MNTEYRNTEKARRQRGNKAHRNTKRQRGNWQGGNSEYRKGTKATRQQGTQEYKFDN